MTLVLNLACDKGEERRGAGVCLEHGVDAGEENKIQNCVLFFFCGVAFPFLSSPNCRISQWQLGKQTQRSVQKQRVSAN